ncbi:hypothetical protein [Serpentinicella alkaliphila]|uniref:Uncharacterized protein n=2 Tax=Serpentinicella alkaliphila TaxID=1734049 RepID=A0A4V2T3W0_9FIRM|nr:hypothetical protein [Serpentinicella alkaliphila]TCQ02914.1 hypothetical protein EDD79_101244 [Serpentinicella alkaliphila]
MYIGHKKTKNKYQLYLVHSKRKNGKSIKEVNQYLCSIDSDDIEGADSEVLGIIVVNVREKIQKSIEKIPQSKRLLLASLGQDINMVVINKLIKVAKG